LSTLLTLTAAYLPSEVIIKFTSGWANNIQIKATAMERFSAMPKKVSDQIYEELFYILKPTDLESAKNAFHDLHGQSSTYEQKAQAIEKYLNPIDKEMKL